MGIGDKPNMGVPVQPLNQTPPPPDMGAATSMEVSVPLEALASPGEDDKLVNPEVGDLVQFQTEGKVARIEGDSAFVSVESVNGKPVSQKAAITKDTPEQEQNNEFAQLQSEAGQQMM